SPRDRETDSELGAAAFDVRCLDRTAVGLGDRLRDRKPETGPVSLRVLAPVEPLEESRLRTLRQARTAVADADEDGAVLALALYVHRRAAWRVLHRVVEHVQEQLRQFVRIASQRRQGLRAGNVEGHARILGLHLERRHRALEQTRRRDVLAPDRLRPRLETGDLEQPLDHPDEPPRLAVDDLRHVRDRVAARLAFHDRLSEPLYRRERRAQLVRYVGEEGLLATARALDLARHLVERGAHLSDLARSRERDPSPVVAARESPHPGDEVAEWSRDRSREQRRDKDGEAERDETAERE